MQIDNDRRIDKAVTVGNNQLNAVAFSHHQMEFYNGARRRDNGKKINTPRLIGQKVIDVIEADLIFSSRSSLNI